MAFTFSIKDTYRQAVEAASGGKQTVLYDDKGYPSIMNIIPKLSYKDVGLSDSTKALPAFMVDDAEKPEIFVGTFMAMVHDGRACSLFEYHTFLHHSQTSNLKMNCFHLHKTGTQTSDGY